jgi:small subunit ribosomal protein S17
MPRRVLEGKVVSNKNTKTVTVLVERKIRDPLYGKIMRRSAKYAAHAESKWQIGDLVSIEECRPISKSKKWIVTGGKAMGESQAETVDDAGTKRASVKRDVAGEEAPAKAAPKAEAKTETKKPAAKKTKKDE